MANKKSLADQPRFTIVLIVFSSILITGFHHWILKEFSPHVVLEELYYLPLFFGALVFGLKGAIVTYLLVSGLYLPFLFGTWTISVWTIVDRILHLLFSGVFASLAGYFVDRERSDQKQKERDRYLTGLGASASTIAHDLKNPLITIQGYARRLKEGKGNQEEALKTIMESASTMEKIVQDVLAFARPIRLEVKEEDLNGIIRTAVDSCKTKAENANVILSAEMSSQAVTFCADALRLQRALVNMINNAIEASREGQEVRLEVKKDRDRVVIVIKDQGAGMDQETLDNLFVPFYSKKSQGTGLGMAIAKKIIDEHQGKILVRSFLNQGTEVRIELPFLREGEEKKGAIIDE